VSTINIRAKGATAERDVANQLNEILQPLLIKHGHSTDVPVIQRNQNQSAVGGCDLSNTFDLAIEVKRHETLSIPTWWKQCEEQAKRNDHKPILIFRQSRAKWRVIMYGSLALPSLSGSGSALIPIRVEITWEDFKVWFKHYADRKLQLEEVKH
jgi:hypothetical protein